MKKISALVTCASALIALMTYAKAAPADDITECYSGRLGTRIPACTAVIDNPATSDYDRTQALDARSVDLSIAGKFSEAMQDIEQSLKITPDSAVGLNARAWTLYRWKNTDQGMDDVNKALQLNSGFAAAWDTRAHLLQFRGQFAKAFDEYEAAVAFGGEAMIRIYQCGLKDRGLYKGPVNGIYSKEMRTALRSCASSKACDPLPNYEFQQDCEDATS